MKSIKVLTIAAFAVGCGFLTVPNASADTVFMTSPSSFDLDPTTTVIDSTFTSPTVITQPAVIIDQPAPVIRMAPSVVATPIVQPMVVERRHNSLLRLGVPGLLNFSLF